MCEVLKFVRPEREIPAWILTYSPEEHVAAITLKDVQLLADRVNKEHSINTAWASNAGGKLHIVMAGKGQPCRHRIDIEPEDSYSAILDRINRAAVDHVDQCLGRASEREQQMTLFA